MYELLFIALAIALTITVAIEFVGGWRETKNGHDDDR